MQGRGPKPSTAQPRNRLLQLLQRWHGPPECLPSRVGKRQPLPPLSRGAAWSPAAQCLFMDASTSDHESWYSVDLVPVRLQPLTTTMNLIAYIPLLGRCGFPLII